MSLLPARLRALPRAVLLLTFADLVAILAIGIGSVSMNWWIVTKGSATDLAIFNIGAALVMLSATLLGSGLGDRVCKARLMAWGTLLAAVSGILLSLYAWLGEYHLVPIMLLYGLDVIGFALVIPASQSLTAELVPAEQLTEALAIQKSGRSMGRMGGFMLGGVLVAALSIPLALACWAGVMLLGAVAAFAMPPKATTPGQTARKHSLVRDAADGMQALWRVPVERYWVLYSLLQILFFMPCIGMLLPLHIHDLKLGAQWLGASEAALGLGMFICSLWGAQRLSQKLGRMRACILAMLMNAGSALLIGLSTSGWPIALAMTMIGSSMAVTQLIGGTHRMLALPDHYRSRFSALHMMVANLGSMAGPALAAMFLTTVPVAQLYLFYAGGIFLLSLCFPLIPGLRAMLALPHEEVKGLYQRQYPAAFAKPVAG